MAFRWANVPIPETYVAALVGAGVMHVVAPMRLPMSAFTARILAWPMLAGGIALAAWAVASAGDVDVERESKLVTTGAYEVSRNPMYTGWSAAVLGIAAIRRDACLLAGWLLATRAVHGEVLEEEAKLSRHFGEAYSGYRRTVPRYLSIKLGRRTARGPRQARLRRGPRGPAQRPASARSKSR